MRKLVVLLCLAAVCAGCFSVVRIPFPHHEQYSDDGVCTNRQWSALIDEPKFSRKCWPVYPTVYIRCYATRVTFSPIDYTKTGEDLYREKHKRWAAIPLTILWLTSPLDAVVDTVFIPFDLCREAPDEASEGQGTAGPARTGGQETICP